MPYNSRKMGVAQYNSFVQLPSSFVPSVSAFEGPDSHSYTLSGLSPVRYAELVYQVNAMPVTISGDVQVDSVGIDDSGTVQVSGDQLKVFDQEAIDAARQLIMLGDNYSQIVKVDGDFTYVMKAEIGLGTSAEAIWQIQRIYDNGSDTTEIMWADGNADFDNVAADYATSITYSF